MVPNGWEHVRLNNLCLTVTSGSRDWAKYYAEQGSKFIRMTNLQRDNIYLNLSDLKFVDVKSDSSDGKRTSLKAGDILMSITAELGKIGWVHEGLGEAFINQHTALIRLDERKSHSKYIAYLLSSKEMNHKINRLNDSGAKAGLNLPTIRSIPIDVPPLPEQRKIAKILSTWDKAISTTVRLIDNSKQQKKALMQQLLTGKKRLLDDSGKPFEGEWEEVALGDIAKIYQSKTISQSKLTSSGYPVYGANGIIGKYSDFNHDTEQVAVTCRGSTCGIVNWTLPKSWITGNAMVVNLDANKSCSKKFIYYLLSGSNLTYLITGSGQPQITGEIKNHKVTLPKTDEQEKIAAVLTNADKEIELLKKQLAGLKQEKKALMQQLLTGKRRVKVDDEAVA
ncbi:restriction endonuclease subunit S [Pseudoalteromonas sp. CAL260-MNA-CIBAN-0059]|uniref:restriction endonuclease subunit S n=1 Tax=Pseudoalteromonas sp. CAL260-MNA-CIBAN-0059 TaxID=3140430 RepID=UPI003318058D|tara:strand:- start:7460 stop:8641 length:1182 start_codon:yes stop_codon:yes gene_type:complete